MNACAAPAPTSSPSWPRSALRVSAVALFVLVQIFLAAWIVPRFTAIFHDMIGDRPLPMLTAIVIHGRWIMAAVACACYATALLIVRREKSRAWIFALIAIVILQVVVTLVALFMPLNVIIKQLSGTA